jgi:hypothetical protein
LINLLKDVRESVGITEKNRIEEMLTGVSASGHAGKT